MGNNGEIGKQDEEWAKWAEKGMKWGEMVGKWEAIVGEMEACAWDECEECAQARVCTGIPRIGA